MAQVELQRLQQEFKKAKELRARSADYVLNLDGNDDLNSYFEDDTSISNDQRQRLLNNSELIERTGTHLTDGYRIALETEALGTQVLNDLHHQRETLNSARSRLRETNADLGRASRTLTSMMLRSMREKAILYGVGVCFIVIVGLSIYFSISCSTTAT